ncbi:hypothetical protein [Enterobacter hormaechei]|uniref:hypothetical protein n=1 Tax=Enterobacter hormaechei TaxID=158836 RepID=UPI001251477E|nr:hypothetical protein [Enterobacter hormaechei]VAF06500.1 Uncharacterised protein [Enterobacter hormaechei]
MLFAANESLRRFTGKMSVDVLPLFACTADSVAVKVSQYFPLSFFIEIGKGSVALVNAKGV